MLRILKLNRYFYFVNSRLGVSQKFQSDPCIRNKTWIRRIDYETLHFNAFYGSIGDTRQGCQFGFFFIN